VTHILDGRALAAARAPTLRACVQRLGSAGRRPHLFLLAFAGPDGRAPWIEGKLRACREAGVEVTSPVLHEGSTTGDARAALEEALAGGDIDGVFVQFPFPDTVDGDALAASIPRAVDIDVMGPHSVRAFLRGAGGRPPLTVAGTLALLDAHAVRLEERIGLVVGGAVPFNRMFAEALGRRGARMTLVAPDTPELPARLADADLVVASAARPGILRSGDMAAGSVVIDGGYFNPGGRGDVDVSGGTDHLEALAPVPGGIGPMTVSALVEAVIERAEHGRAGD